MKCARGRVYVVSSMSRVAVVTHRSTVDHPGVEVGTFVTQVNPDVFLAPARVRPIILFLSGDGVTAVVGQTAILAVVHTSVRCSRRRVNIVGTMTRPAVEAITVTPVCNGLGRSGWGWGEVGHLVDIKIDGFADVVGGSASVDKIGQRIFRSVAEKVLLAVRVRSDLRAVVGLFLEHRTDVEGGDHHSDGVPRKASCRARFPVWVATPVF
mmetsp:Transcript_7176/g.13594  ORF Transcript_7176/g.13594 Transcript_7176/m.13594 type:complete len:210 (+) Transcript_7176:519-1148(+)